MNRMKLLRHIENWLRVVAVLLVLLMLILLILLFAAAVLRKGLIYENPPGVISVRARAWLRAIDAPVGDVNGPRAHLFNDAAGGPVVLRIKVGAHNSKLA